MNGKITLEDIRKVLSENVDYSFNGKTQSLEDLSDDKLLKVDLLNDLKLDSLDLMVLTMSLERNCDVVIPDDAFDAFKEKGSTIEVLLEECNRFLIAK